MLWNGLLDSDAVFISYSISNNKASKLHQTGLNVKISITRRRAFQAALLWKKHSFWSPYQPLLPPSKNTTCGSQLMTPNLRCAGINYDRSLGAMVLTIMGLVMMAKSKKKITPALQRSGDKDRRRRRRVEIWNLPYQRKRELIALWLSHLWRRCWGMISGLAWLISKPSQKNKWSTRMCVRCISVYIAPIYDRSWSMGWGNQMMSGSKQWLKSKRRQIEMGSK